MGCCASQDFTPSSKPFFSQKLKEAIDSCNTHKIALFSKLFQSSPSPTPELDEEFITINGKKLSPLAYTLHSGNTKMFSHLLSIGCSVSAMNTLLESQGTRAINLICSKNYADLLQAYLPIYMQSQSVEQSKFEYPIHSACKSGSLGILKYLQSYFSLKPAPVDFSIETLNEYGENAALIACRYGHIDIVKYLRDICRVNLKVFNKKNENALLVCLYGYKSSPSLGHLDLVFYLVEEVGIDVRYMYKDVMRAAESKEIVNYLEGKLDKLGIFCRKRDLGESFLVETVMSEESVGKAEDEGLLRSGSLRYMSTIARAKDDLRNKSFM